MFENLIQRAKNMILTPQSEWDVVAQETVSTGDVYKNYVAPLSAIPPLERWRGVTILNDVYNANPSSMEVALDELVRFAVFCELP